jgi:hypothetical protein
MAKKSSQGAKAPKGKVVRINLSVGEEEAQLLMIRALTSGRSAGELVTSLISAKVKEWGLPVNLLVRTGQVDRLNVSGHMNSPDTPEVQTFVN